MAAKTGDRDALGELVERTQADVWRFCAALLSPDQADDATQETFLQAWRSAPTFRGEGTAKTWLLAIARRVCAHTIRGAISRRNHDLKRREAAVPDAGDHGEVVALYDLVAHLESNRRSAFVLTRLLGLSYEEAADVCGCPVGTIRSRVARARADLIALDSHEATTSEDLARHRTS